MAVHSWRVFNCFLCDNSSHLPLECKILVSRCHNLFDISPTSVLSIAPDTQVANTHCFINYSSSIHHWQWSQKPVCTMWTIVECFQVALNLAELWNSLRSNQGSICIASRRLDSSVNGEVCWVIFGLSINPPNSHAPPRTIVCCSWTFL